MQNRTHLELVADPDTNTELLTALPGAVIRLVEEQAIVTPTRLRELVAKQLELIGSDMLIKGLEDPNAGEFDLPYLAGNWRKSLQTPADRLLKVDKKTFSGSVLDVRMAVLGVTDEWIAANMRDPQEVSRDRVKRMAVLASMKSTGRPAIAQGIEVVVLSRLEPHGAGRYVISCRTSEKVHNQAALEAVLAESAAIGRAVAANAMLHPATVAPPGSGRRRK
jgi:hypothetical protein